MKKIVIISIPVLILVVGVALFVSNRQSSDDLTTTENTLTEITKKEDGVKTSGTNEQKQTNTNQQQTPVSLGEAVWILSSFFQKSDKVYIDLERDGDMFSKQDKGGTTEVRRGKVSSDVANRVFAIIGSRSVLNTKDTGEGEPLFSQSEWASVAIFADGNLKTSASAPVEDFPPEFQNLLKELKSLASSQVVDTATKAVLFAELVDSKRADSIKNDPRKFYEFLALNSGDLTNTPAVKQAITMLGRQVSIADASELQKLEGYIRQSNLKSISKEFFISVGSKSYQLQLVEIK